MSYQLIASSNGSRIWPLLLLCLLIFIIFFGGFFTIKKMAQKDERNKKAIQEREEQRKKAIIDEKDRQYKTWLNEGYSFNIIDIKKVCENFITKIGEERFYNPNLSILQTILATYPILMPLYPDFIPNNYTGSIARIFNEEPIISLNSYQIEEQAIIRALKDAVFQTEKIVETEENIIRCYSSIRKTILSILASRIEKDFDLTTNDYYANYMSNTFIIHDNLSNIFKLSIYVNVRTNSTLTIKQQYEITKERIAAFQQRAKEEKIKNSLLYGQPKEKKNYVHTIEDTDFMTGMEFEVFLGKHFQLLGYKVEYTKASGDQGIDLIITKNDQKIGIQAKCYSQKVSNKAIQEAVAGKAYYNLDRVIVITNNYYTQSAKELATSNNVILWDRDTLIEKFF